MKYILKGFLLLSLLYIGKTQAHAQDESIQSHYILNPIMVNTGATGFYDEHRVRFNFKNHWSGFEGAPSNYMLSYNGRVSDHDGIGIVLNSESYNAINRNRAKLSYGYNFRINDVDLGLGLGVDYQQESLKSSAYNNGQIDSGDPIINELADGAKYLGADFGVYGAYKDKWTFGLGIPNLFRSRLDDTVVPDSLNASTLFKYFSLQVGYMFHSENSGVTVNPSVMYRKSFRYTNEFDLNLLVTFLEGDLITGVSYTLGGREKLAAMLGGRFNNFSLVYSYDITFRDFHKYNGGSHELTLGIDIPNGSSLREIKDTDTED